MSPYKPRPEHWEPPHPRPLLVSTRRIAQELDIPIWKATGLSYALGRFHYGPKAVHFRVSRRALDAFKALLEIGVSFEDARTTVYHCVMRGELPGVDSSADHEKAKAMLEKYHRRPRRRRRRAL